jgi:nifR3 family TIM-barrel protein
MGSDPETMARAAVVLNGLGFDVIDLNFACPVRKVVSRGRGGFLMSQPELALRIVRAVRAAVPGRPLALKLRKGFRADAESTRNFWTIAGGALEAGADALCVHGRTVDQMYSGAADWGFLGEVKRAFGGATVIGSGDVRAAGDALRMISETAVDGVAAARGAIGNPWFFGQVRDLAEGRTAMPPSLPEQRALLERHFRLTLEQYGMRKAALIMRHFGIGYARIHPHPKTVRMGFVQVKTEEDWRRVLETHYT